MRWVVLVMVAVLAIGRFWLTAGELTLLPTVDPPAIGLSGVLQQGPSSGGTAEPAPGPVLINPYTDGDETGTLTVLQGDEVSTAVARYRVDRNGNLYELHAPQSEVAKLPSPIG